MYLKTKVSTIVIIPRVSELNLPILKIVRLNGVVSLLHVLSGKGTNRGRVVMAQLVALSVARKVILCESV